MRSRQPNNHRSDCGQVTSSKPTRNVFFSFVPNMWIVVDAMPMSEKMAYDSFVRKRQGTKEHTMKYSKSNENAKNAKPVAAAMAHQVADDFDKAKLFDFDKDDDIFDYVPPTRITASDDGFDYVSPVASPAFHAIKTNEQIFAEAGVTGAADDGNVSASSAVAFRGIAKPVHAVRRANRFGRTESIMSVLTAVVVLCVPFVSTLLASLVSNYVAAVAVYATAMYSMLGVGACGAMVAVIAYAKRGKEWQKQFSIIAGCTIMTAVIAASAIKLIALVVSGM